MSVVQITKYCSLSCTYCFDKYNQKDHLLDKKVIMNQSTFDKYIKRMWEFFASNKDDRSVCISWWEPTLHPDFKAMVNKVLNSWFSTVTWEWGFNVYLLSNFTFDPKLCNFLKPLIEWWRLATMVNVNSPYEKYAWMTSVLWEKTITNLKTLQSPEVRLSFNIFSPDISYDFIFETLEQLPKVDKIVRLWVVNPIILDLRRKDTYVFQWEMWEMYKKLWKITDWLVDKLTDLWYKIYLDCWVWRCIFDPKTVEKIKENWWQTHWCSLPNDEVSVNWEYWSCYTLYNFWNEDKTVNINSLSVKRSRWHFILKTEFFKEHYLILPKCLKCPLLKEWCPRFCVSNNIFYWEKHFEKWWKDEFFDKMEDLHKKFAKIEYFLSKNNLENAKKEISEIENFSEIEKNIFDEKINPRFYFYNILVDFLMKKDSKNISIERINKIMHQVSEKKIKLSEIDFKLLKISELLIKNLKLG